VLVIWNARRLKAQPRQGALDQTLLPVAARRRPHLGGSGRTEIAVLLALGQVGSAGYGKTDGFSTKSLPGLNVADALLDRGDRLRPAHVLADAG